jgi:hypothetical protein
VDRYDRKLMMIISDLASGLTTIAVLILADQGRTGRSGSRLLHPAAFRLARDSNLHPTARSASRLGPRASHGPGRWARPAVGMADRHRTRIRYGAAFGRRRAVASGTALGGYAIPAVREVETILPGIKPAAPVGIRWTRRHGRGGARGSNYRAGLVAGGRPVELTPALGRRNLPDGRL